MDQQELSRSDSWEMFPAGLKVLVVDDDPLCLKVVEHMLRRCNYQGESAQAPSSGQIRGPGDLNDWCKIWAEGVAVDPCLGNRGVGGAIQLTTSVGAVQ